jgi:lipopolysaccharide/colanic/teichoic acid biosynthesis glycosyltransferase
MIKRTLDLALCIVAFVALGPVLVLVWIAVRLALGSPALFVQERPGLNGRPFLMRKFRSMTDARSVDGSLKPDSERLTPFGRFLRSSSLDELPELWNVLVGDMSFVGPRPLLMQYLPLYTERQRRRHEVRPGITGWAQVNGRNAVGWEQRFEMDVWYVDNQTVWLDLKIIGLTFLRVVQRSGISAEGDATMPAFQGAPASCTAGETGSNSSAAARPSVE